MSTHPASPVMRHIVCAACLQINRMDMTRALELAICARCKTKLLPPIVTECTTATFQRFMTQHAMPCVVDFWASWCGPCKMMAPQFLAAATKWHTQFSFLKVNTETEQKLASQMRIVSLPTLIVFNGSLEVARQSGAMSEPQLSQWLKSLRQAHNF